MKFYIILACILFARPSEAQQRFDDRLRLTPEVEARLDTDYDTHGERWSLLRPALSLGIRGRNQDLRLLPDRFAVSTRARQWQLWHRDAKPTTNSEFDVMELNGEWRGNDATLTLGVQEVVWGDTIGVPVIDLVNPRDLREPIFADSADSRLPALMARIDWQPTSAFNAQILGVPAPPSPRVPERLEGIAVDRPERIHRREGAEFGSRLGWLFDSGLDLKLYGLRHHNRNAVYEPYLDGTTPKLCLIQSAMHTVGTGFSYPLQSMVWRGDIVRQVDQPIYDASIRRIKHGSLMRATGGVDWTGSDEVFVAVQISQDRYDASFDSSLEQARLTWATFKVSLPFFHRRLKLEALALRGIDHSDLWLQPKLVFATAGGFSADLRADLIEADRAGYFAAYRDSDRVRLSLRYRL